VDGNGAPDVSCTLILHRFSTDAVRRQLEIIRDIQYREPVQNGSTGYRIGVEWYRIVLNGSEWSIHYRFGTAKPVLGWGVPNVVLLLSERRGGGLGSAEQF
jgi:hypothetical protein